MLGEGENYLSRLSMQIFPELIFRRKIWGTKERHSVVLLKRRKNEN